MHKVIVIWLKHLSIHVPNVTQPTHTHTLPYICAIRFASLLILAFQQTFRADARVSCCSGGYIFQVGESLATLGERACLWGMTKFNPESTPLKRPAKFGTRYYVRDPYGCTTFVANSSTGGFWAMGHSLIHADRSQTTHRRRPKSFCNLAHGVSLWKQQSS